MVELKTLEKLRIEKDRCKGCEYCVALCPKSVLEMSRELNARGVHYVRLIDPENCTSCMVCAIMCPDVCIEVYK